MPASSPRRRIARLAPIAGALLCAWPALAGTGPRPPRARKSCKPLSPNFCRRLAGDAGLINVRPEGADYLVSVDLSAFNSLFKASGANVSYDPAILTYKLTEQDDGKWRLVQGLFPKIVSRANDVVSTVDVTNSTAVASDRSYARLVAQRVVGRGQGRHHDPWAGDRRDDRFRRRKGRLLDQP